MLTEQQVRDRQNATPAGKLLLRMGLEYYDTESCARKVAEFAAAKLEKAQEKNDAMLAALRRILPYCMDTDIDPEPTPLYEHYHASKAVRAAIAKAEGKE